MLTFQVKESTLLPATIDIEPNNNCNLRCEHCQVSHWTKDIRYLDIKSYRYILNQFPYLLSAKLQGMGEPFLNRQLPFMLKEGEERGISMLVFTNGTIYDEHLAKKLIQLKILIFVLVLMGQPRKSMKRLEKGVILKKSLGILEIWLIIEV